MSTEPVTQSHGLLDDGKPPRLHALLHTCNLQTLQPTVSWLQLQDIFAKRFAALIETRITSSEENLALFQLLGMTFMVKYLPGVKVEPCITEPSTEILQDMNTWIKQQFQVVANELGFNSLFSGDTSSEKTSDEIQILRRHIATIAQNNLDLFLLKDKQERKKTMVNSDKRYSSSLLGMVNACSRQEPKEKRKSPKEGTRVKQAPCNDDDDDVSQEMSGRQSESIGEIVSSILQRHPSKAIHMMSALSGRRLPTSLRTYLWREVFFQSQKHLLNKGNIEQMLRLEFGQTIQKNCQELKIKHATKSPINCLIENAVIETYSKIQSLQRFSTDAHLKEAARVLNVLYVYDKTYRPYLIHWLLPLQLTFSIETKDPVKIGEHVCELAMYLTLVRSSCVPQELQVLTNAKKILGIIKEQDPILYAHIYQIAKINLLDDPKDVPLRDYLAFKEKQEMETISSELKRLDLTSSVRYLESSDPVFYIYKWIKEGFVSVLDSAAMLWVWDQCFLQNWNPKVLCDVSLALILLLRSYFLDATDNSQIKKVFLNLPLQLFTKDIQKAWIHIQDKKPLIEVSKMNRQHFQPDKRISSPDISSILGNRDDTRYMTSFSLEILHLQLEFLPNVLQESDGEIVQIPWTKSPNMENIVINVRSQFGQTTAAAKHVSGPPTKLKTKVDMAGRLTAVLSVDCLFEFQSYDAAEYKSAIKQGGLPYAVASVHYIDGTTDVPLGWAYIPLVEQDAWNNQKWAGIHEQLSFPLHPGDVPVEFLVTETDIPTNERNLSKCASISICLVTPLRYFLFSTSMDKILGTVVQKGIHLVNNRI